MGSIHKNIARYELTTVYKHPSAKADIVLVHGLNGNPVKTWTAPNNGVYWPTDLLPASLKNEHANILVYGYNADVFASKKDKSPSDNFVHMHAQSLVTSLTQYRKSEGTDRLPLIWVAHSLGGIVTKRALLYSNDVRAHHHEDYRSIFVSTYGIIFLGTPHVGSDLAGWGRVLQYMSEVVIPRRFFETESVLLKTLKKDNETLASINNHFLDIYQRFRIHMVHENHTTDIRGSKVFVVDASSASPQLPGVTYYGIEANHSGMCKFESETAPGYRNVSTALREWVADSPKVIQVRWEVEEDDRRLRAHLENYERVRAYQRAPAPGQHPPVAIVEDSHVPNKELGFCSEHTLSVADRPVPLLPAPTSQTSLTVEEITSQHGQPVPPSQSLDTSITLGRASQPPPIRAPSPHPPLFIHPEKFRPNSYFIGREDELRGLHEMLMDRRRRSEGTSAVLIQCLPGGGKTHLARQYVFQHKDDYPGGIYWVRAKSRQEIEYWYWRIAKNEALRGLLEQQDVDELRDPGKIVDVVRKWLSSQEDWLLVLDGVQFDIDGLHDFIPDARNTGLIYTSTERAVTGEARFDNPQVMELGPLTAQQAQALLLLEMDRKPPWSEDEKTKAGELVELMGRLPLMIHVAAQHLKATREPLTKYLKSYRSRPRAGSLSAYRAVREQLEHRGSNAALNLISLLVFYDQHIPVEMITLGLSALDKTTPIKSCDASQRKTNLNNTLRILIAFALVERTESDDISPSNSRSSKSSFGKHTDYLDLLRIHSIVQAFFIDSLQEEKQVDFWLERATAVWCRSYDEAHKRIQEDPQVGRPDDYRRFAIHGEKLLQNLGRFEKRYPRLLSPARIEVQTRLDGIQGQVDKLSKAIQEGIIEGSEQQSPASVFERSSSVSDTDSAQTPSNQDSQGSYFMGEGEVQSPVAFDPASWQAPYPATPVSTFPTMPLMPEGPPDGPAGDADDEDIVMVMSPVLGSQREFEDWQEGIPQHRVLRRQESRRYHDRAGAWRDTTVSDPRVSISHELAAGSVSGRMASRSRSGNRAAVTAQSDAEMELNKIRQAMPISPQEPVELPQSGPVRANYLLGRNSYAQASAKPAPEEDLNIAPVSLSSGLAQIISSPKSWTHATVKRLKQNVLPSKRKAPSVPSSPVISQHEYDTVPSTVPGPIFAGTRSNNSSPSMPSSPFPPPTFSALQDTSILEDYTPSVLPIRRYDTTAYPSITRFATASSDPPDPLSLSYPAAVIQPPPVWILAAPPPSGYSSQPASIHDPSPPRRPLLSQSGTPTLPSSPLAISTSSSPTPHTSTTPQHRHLHPLTRRRRRRRPSFTDSEPSPRRDAFDVDTSYSRWEQLHHHSHHQPHHENLSTSFPPPHHPRAVSPAPAPNPALDRIGRGTSSSSRSHSLSPRGSPSHSPVRGRGGRGPGVSSGSGGASVSGVHHPLAVTAYSSPAGSPRPTGSRQVSPEESPSLGGPGSPAAGIRVAGGVVEFGVGIGGSGLGISELPGQER